MNQTEEANALRQLDAHAEKRSNPMGQDEFRIIETRRFVPYEGAEPRWLIIKDERCIF